MIGIVIVSHSAKIAEGVVELCYEMVGKDMKILPAGGTADGRIGTDPMLIKTAIENAYSGDPVVILADIGSSIMNAEMGKELLDEEIQEKTYILDTPIVEGGIAVSVQAYISSNIEKILDVAEEARNTRKFS